MSEERRYEARIARGVMWTFGLVTIGLLWVAPLFAVLPAIMLGYSVRRHEEASNA